MKKKIVIIGPTGIGKTEIATKVGLHFNGEIISTDSMQIYQGMTVGTGAPSEKQLLSVPHHMIGFLSPAYSYNAFQFMTDAGKKIHDIEFRNKQVILTGGTGLYLRSLLQGLMSGTVDDQKEREKLEEEELIVGTAALFTRLKEVDPEYSAKISPNDSRRIIRALAFHSANQIPFSSYHQQWGNPVSKEFILVGLNAERSRIYSRINQRVELMMKQGFLNEAYKLKQMNLPDDSTALQAIGYKLLFQVIEKKIPENEAVEQIKKETRHYAKRQLTWFRKIDNINWFNIESENYLSRIIEFLEKGLAS